MIITNDPSFTGVGVIYVIDVTDPAAPSLASATPVEVPGLNGVATRRDRATATSPTASRLPLPVDDRLLGGAHRLRPRRPRPSRVRGRLQGARRRLHPRRPDRRHRHRMGHRRGRDVRLRRHGDDRSAGAAAASTAATRRHQHRQQRAVDIPLASAHDSPLDFLHHNSQRASGPDLLAVTEEDYLRPGCEGQGSLQTWRITDEHNADGTIKLELLDLWTTELNELMDGTGRSNPPTGQLLGALVRRVGLGSSPRAGTTRACASWTSPTRANQAGRLLRQPGRVLGRVLRAQRPDAPGRLRARRGRRDRRAEDRSLRRRAPAVRAAGARDRPRRHAGAAPDLPLRLPAGAATGRLAPPS